MALIDQVPNRQVWKFMRGDSVEHQFQVGTAYPNGDFEPWDLTGWTISGSIKVNEDDASVIGTITGTINPTQAGETKGVYTLAMTPAVTGAMAGKYVADIQFTSSGGMKTTLQRFELRATKDTTA